jgi:hypothetical protein
MSPTIDHGTPDGEGQIRDPAPMVDLGAEGRVMRSRVERAGALLERLLVAADRLLPGTPATEQGQGGESNDGQVEHFVDGGGHESLRSVAYCITAVAHAMDELNDYTEQRRQREVFADALHGEIFALGERGKSLAAAFTEGDAYAELDRLMRRAVVLTNQFRNGYDSPIEADLPTL